MTMADTVAVMNMGRIEQLGAPEVLYELPRTRFVANFLGQSNLFDGTVTSSSGSSIIVQTAGHHLEVPRNRAARHDGAVTIGVRPEKLRLHSSAAATSGGRNVLGPGRITDVSFSGVSTQYLVAIPGLGTIVVFAQNSDTGPLAHPGDEVWVSWAVQHAFGLEDTPAEGTAGDGGAEASPSAPATPASGGN